MVNCEHCGKDIYMPFKCKYCSKSFCADHRLPEAHDCKDLVRGPGHREQVQYQQPAETEYLTPEPVQQDYYEPTPSRRRSVPSSDDDRYGREEMDIPEDAIDVEEYTDPETGETVVRYYVYDTKGIRKFLVPWGRVKKPEKPILGITSKREVWQLSLGTLIIFFITLTLFLAAFFPLLGAIPIPLFIAVIGFAVLLGVLAFVGHELAHKFTSIALGYWSEFRLTPFFTIISAVSIFLPFKFALPGAVMIPPQAKAKKTMGKIAAAGPLYNFFFGLVIVIILFIFGSYSILGIGPTLGLGTLGLFQTPLAIGVFLNYFLGIFNMIPIAILDGKKVMKWSVLIWVGELMLLLVALGVFFVFFIQALFTIQLPP